MRKPKYADEYIKQICEEKELKFIDIKNIIDKNNKSRKFVNFICRKHEDKGIQSRPIEKIINNKKPCQYCNHSKLKETFKSEIANINPNIDILSNYINWDTKIHCRCKIHKEYEWDASVSVLLSGGGCKICGHKKIWDSRGRITTNDFKNKMEKVNSNIEIIGKYMGAHSLIKCRCKIDNTEWESYPSNLLNKSAGCPKCAIRHLQEIESLGQDEFIKRLHKTNKNIIVLEQYHNADTKLRFKCKIHNYIFKTSPRTFSYKGGKGCPYCNQSMGERKMISILENQGFKIQQQYTFKDCICINKLRFDAYDIENNIAYEYQGQQHYYPIDFAGKGEEWAKNNFDINIKRDNIKIQYCKNSNIPLIIIPYWEFDNMEEFIKMEQEKYIA